MRKVFFHKGTAAFAAMLMFITTNMMFVSCNQPDDAYNEEEIESPEGNLPDAAKAFVGCWSSNDYNNSSSYRFVFFPDGTCWFSNSSEGYWAYNESTMILATTIDGYQWQVTLSNSEVWTGIDINRGTVKTFKKSVEEFRSLLFSKYSWSDSDGEINLTHLQKGEFRISYSSDNKKYSFSTKEMKDDFTYVGSIYSPYGNMQQMITIENPYDLSKVSIRLSGEINATLYPTKK